ncbi:MAG TPA: hypothetical protein IGR64_15420 [Leptolyngbyaceae cyanobacterium M65_K2018_010]|nr:hypothetical protein [Leptolyngbyaceae cyanobacterium M65_K2018_010]
MKKVLTGLLASVCCAALPIAAQAHSHGPEVLNQGRAQQLIAQLSTNPGTQPESVEDIQVFVVDLTDDQVAQITAIFNNYEPQIVSARVDYLQSLEVLNDLLVPTTADLALTDAYNNALAADQALSTLYLQRLLAIRSVLTIPQRQVINEAFRAYLGLPEAQPVAVFPMNLVGQDSSSTIAALQADGWVVVFSTPGEVGLNRGDQKLNLEMNRSGKIIDAELLK